MTGFTSKRQAALDKLDDDDAQGYIAQFEEALQKEYKRGYDAGKASQPVQEPVAWAIYDKRGGSKSLHWLENHSPDGDATKFDAVPLYTTQPKCTVQVSPLEFVEMVMDKEHLVGNPIVWAQWPNKEKNFD